LGKTKQKEAYWAKNTKTTSFGLVEATQPYRAVAKQPKTALNLSLKRF
jgi:hypothetical protein